MEDRLADLGEQFGDQVHPFGCHVSFHDVSIDHEIMDEVVHALDGLEIAARQSLERFQYQGFELVPVEVELLDRAGCLDRVRDRGMTDDRLDDPDIVGRLIPFRRDRVPARELGCQVLRAGRLGLRVVGTVHIGQVVVERDLKLPFQTRRDRPEDRLGLGVMAVQGAMLGEVGIGLLVGCADVSTDFPEEVIDRLGGGFLVAEFHRPGDFIARPGEFDHHRGVVDRPGDFLGLRQPRQQGIVVGRGGVGLLEGLLAYLLECLAVLVEQVERDRHAVSGAVPGGEVSQAISQGAEDVRVAAQLLRLLLERLAGGPVLAASPLAKRAGMGLQEGVQSPQAVGGIEVGQAFQVPLQVVEVGTAGRHRQELPGQAFGMERRRAFLIRLGLGLEQMLSHPGRILALREAIRVSHPEPTDQKPRQPVRGDLIKLLDIEVNLREAERAETAAVLRRVDGIPFVNRVADVRIVRASDPRLLDLVLELDEVAAGRPFGDRELVVLEVEEQIVGRHLEHFAGGEWRVRVQVVAVIDQEAGIPAGASDESFDAIAPVRREPGPVLALSGPVAHIAQEKLVPRSRGPVVFQLHERGEGVLLQPLQDGLLLLENARQEPHQGDALADQAAIIRQVQDILHEVGDVDEHPRSGPPRQGHHDHDLDAIFLDGAGILGRELQRGLDLPLDRAADRRVVEIKGEPAHRAVSSRPVQHRLGSDLLHLLLEPGQVIAIDLGVEVPERLVELGGVDRHGDQLVLVRGQLRERLTFLVDGGKRLDVRVDEHELGESRVLGQVGIGEPFADSHHDVLAAAPQRDEDRGDAPGERLLLISPRPDRSDSGVDDAHEMSPTVKYVFRE